MTEHDRVAEVERWWLDHSAEGIAASADITAEDLDAAPFADHGGIDGYVRDLGPRAEELLEQLGTELTA